MLESREIVRISSAAALLALRRVKPVRDESARAVLVVADPVFSASDPRVSGAAMATSATDRKSDEGRLAPSRSKEHRERGGVDLRRLGRLTASREEALEIVRVSGPHQVTLLQGLGASRASVLAADMARYRVVHLASHSILDDEHPELSALVLSMVNDQGQPVDGLLLLDDVYRMKLAADLVVLSACDTALGTDVRGEGIVGLTRGFFHAGAQRVIASLWKVDDRATLALMRRFYEKFFREGLPAGAALRQAQLSMLADAKWAFPYYWSAFELHGEWR